jgi:hypothetical protein
MRWQGLLGARSTGARIAALIAGVATYLYLHYAQVLSQAYEIPIGFVAYVIVAVLWGLLARLFQGPTR